MTQLALSARSSTLWPTSSINVCWENPSPTNVGQRNIVRTAIRSTWEAESSVRFTGWGTCSTNSAGIRILINDEGPHVKRLGSELNGMRDGMVLNFTFNNWSRSCLSNVNNCT